MSLVKYFKKIVSHHADLTIRSSRLTVDGIVDDQIIAHDVIELVNNVYNNAIVMITIDNRILYKKGSQILDASLLLDDDLDWSKYRGINIDTSNIIIVFESRIYFLSCKSYEKSDSTRNLYLCMEKSYEISDTIKLFFICYSTLIVYTTNGKFYSISLDSGIIEMKLVGPSLSEKNFVKIVCHGKRIIYLTSNGNVYSSIVYTIDDIKNIIEVCRVSFSSEYNNDCKIIQKIIYNGGISILISSNGKCWFLRRGMLLACPIKNIIDNTNIIDVISTKKEPMSRSFYIKEKGHLYIKTVDKHFLINIIFKEHSKFHLETTEIFGLDQEQIIDVCMTSYVWTLNIIGERETKNCILYTTSGGDVYVQSFVVNGKATVKKVNYFDKHPLFQKKSSSTTKSSRTNAKHY